MPMVRLVRRMRRFAILFVFIFSSALAFAAEPTWNPADAVKEAEQDIKTGNIKFYWSGSIAVMPVGVPIEVAKNYPRENAGVGCVTSDIPLREKQEKYARIYNEKIYDFVLRNPDVGTVKTK